MSRAARIYVPPIAILLALMAGCVESEPTAPTGVQIAPLASITIEAARYQYSPNLLPMGYSPRVDLDPSPTAGVLNTELAFWGNRAYQGSFNGFRILDITNPVKPTEIGRVADCEAGTVRGLVGDLAVWNNILVRAWSTNTVSTHPAECAGLALPVGQKGVHIFDVSNAQSPRVLAFVPACDASGVTLVPDLALNRLVVYVSPGVNSGGCRGFQTIVVPLSNPGAAAVTHSDPTVAACLDIAVILGSVNLMACVNTTGYTLHSMGPEEGGSLVAPVFLGIIDLGSVGHTAAFTWDGAVLVYVRRPAATLLNRCDSAVGLQARELLFVDPLTGQLLGTFPLQRLQHTHEYCHQHVVQVVPYDKKYVVLESAYQAGFSVIDFSNPASPIELAYADPVPVFPGAFPVPISGDWAAHWYNGMIYDSDTRYGLLTWRFIDPGLASALRLTHFNPQTLETSFSMRFSTP